MIPFSEIEQAAAHTGVPVDTVERDYCMVWLLRAIARLGHLMPVAACGASAVRILYFPEHRFTRELEFVVTQEDFFERNKILSVLDEVFYDAAHKSDVHYHVSADQPLVWVKGWQYVINYTGFAQNRAVEKQFRMDFIFGDDEYIGPWPKPILGLYSDIRQERDVSIQAYALEAIVSAKLSAVLNPEYKDPCDVYDLWRLLQHAELNHEAAAESFKHRHRFYPTLNRLKSGLKNMFYPSRWQENMEHLVADLPGYEKVVEEVFEKIGVFWGI